MGRDVRSEYTRRREAREALASSLRALDRRLSAVRLTVVLVAVAAAIVSIGPGWWPIGWAVLPLAVFAALFLYHEGVARRLREALDSVDFYETGLARLDGDFGKGPKGDELADAEHPYAGDLDLFGEGSLFQRVCRARTGSGAKVLAGWLKAPASVGEVEHRREAVEDLRPKLDLREALELLRGSGKPGRTDRVDEWAARKPELFPPWLRPAAGLAAIAAFAGVAAWLTGQGIVYLAGLLPAMALGAAFREKVARLETAAEAVSFDLHLHVAVMERLCAETFTHRHPQELKAKLAEAPRAIARLARTVDRLEWQRNPLFAPFFAMMMWKTQHAIGLARWHDEHGKALPGWLEAVGELEALGSVAGYAYENPEDPWATFADGPLYDGEGLGHPLIPREACKTHDVRLGVSEPLLLISGSNMSGKSTLLRIVGINHVLAHAGIPVRAKSLTLSPAALFAVLRVSDSLQMGRSRFYAEILRLKAAIDHSREAPLLFLFDELLHGTNSEDRRIGAAAVLRSLVRAGALGIATTHDLELTKLVDEADLSARNAHFSDRFEEGTLFFDYKLKPGRVRQGNAIELMRSIGIEV